MVLGEDLSNSVSDYGRETRGLGEDWLFFGVAAGTLFQHRQETVNRGVEDVDVAANNAVCLGSFHFRNS